MTTLTIEIPKRLEKALTMFIEQIGGNIVAIDTNTNPTANSDDENLTPAELELFKRALEEILLIKEGKIKSIPFSELWNK